MESLLVHLATIIPYLRQGSGGPLYGEPETRKCRMEPGTGHKVVWEGQEMLVIRCQQMMGPGLHHLEVDLE